MSVCGISCDIKGCQDSKVWGLVKDGRLYRLTFSKSLAEHINSNLNNQYTLRRYKLVKGRRLSAEDTSSTGLYSIVDARKDYTLRVALDRRVAHMLCDWNWRYLQEVHLIPCK